MPAAASREPTAAELDAAEAEQRPTMPREPGQDWVPPWTIHRRRDDDESRHWLKWLACRGGELHPSTEPGAIATAQRRAVLAAVVDLGAGWTVESVVGAVWLPRDVVLRRLRELGVL